MKTKHVLTKVWVWLACFVVILGGGAVTPAQQSNSQTATVLLTDISGSMDEPDFNGIPKLQSAKNAISTYIDIVEAEATNYNTTDFVSLVTFCETAQQETQFSTDYNLVRNVTQGLSTCGATDLFSGISVSDNLARDIKNQQNSIGTNIILLTDGVPTASPFGSTNSDVLQQEVLDAAASLNLTGTCLYIVPLGDPTAGDEAFVDLNFLRELEAVVNCGELFDIVTPSELRQRYLGIRLQIVNLNTEYNQTLFVTSNQTLDLPEFTIQPNTGQLRVDTVVLDNGTVTVNLFDPTGQQVTASYPGASLSTIGNVIQWVIENPIVGQWRAQVIGTAVDPTTGGTRFTTSVSTGAAPTIPVGSGTVAVTGGTSDSMLLGIILMIFIVAGGVIAGVLYSMNNRSSGGQDIPMAQQGYLVFLSGPRVGQQIAIGSSTFSIGRRGGNDLQLQDNNVSREHARILLRNGQFIVQDLNSQSGTFVNGAQLQAAHPLRNGDQVRIGRINLQFRA